MDIKQKEHITYLFIEIAKDAKQFLATPESVHFTDGLLLNSYGEEREAIVEQLLKDRTYFLKFSEEYLEKLLREKVRELIISIRQNEPGLPQRKARDIAEQLFQELDTYVEKQTVYIPVVGIDIQLEDGLFEIGNITFLNMTQERIDEIIRSYSAMVLASKRTAQEKENSIRWFSEQLQQILTETEKPICALYHVIAEPTRAKERARDECYLVFDLLRYALPALYSTLYPMQFSLSLEEIEDTPNRRKKPAERDERVRQDTNQYLSFGLQGEAPANTIRHAICFSDKSFGWSSQWRGRFFHFQITPDHITRMTEIGVFDVAELLKEEEPRTPFKETLLRGIHWFANAQTPMLPEYVVLSLVSSLEAFVNPPSHDRVTEAVVEGVAALEGEMVYKYAMKRLEKLYGIRSRLSHGDETLIFERNITELRQIAFDVIQYMIQRRNDFRDQKDCFKAIKTLREEFKQKYGNKKKAYNPFRTFLHRIFDFIAKMLSPTHKL